VGLGNALNANNLARQGALQSLQGQISDVDLNRDMSWANAQTDISQQRVGAMQDMNSLDQQQKAADLAAAQNEVALFGKIMTAKAAAALGLPVGTKMKSSGGGGNPKNNLTLEQQMAALGYVPDGKGGWKKVGTEVPTSNVVPTNTNQPRVDPTTGQVIYPASARK
jgi:hypothetical protein